MAAEVKFKYPQPFTWAQVMDLDVVTISQEITRLQHSLDHLKSTQDQLQYFIDTTSESAPDPEFMGAIQENIDVINSQEERVSILKHALVQKGVVSPSHYDLDPSRSTQPASATVDPEPNPPSITGGGDDGLYI
ncbi:hypothetical protein BDM02DRAFT_3109616 [Thelephora ganbajun]|uniref:Uncharacterized protein n=1 Tax=Thelephora ganbajun TaxID=370292 RepID=A0ACB6ZR88_THEGA|nr:hypothetical protein BDM02DRAFT_3109616 [Thelephora ganbajun]